MTPKISRTKVDSLLKKKGVLVDVRDAVSFRDGHLAEAINVSARTVSSLITVLKGKKDAPIVLYGSADNDPNIEMISNYAFQLGFSNVYTIGAMENWNKS